MRVAAWTLYDASDNEANPLPGGCLPFYYHYCWQGVDISKLCCCVLQDYVSSWPAGPERSSSQGMNASPQVLTSQVNAGK